LAHKIKQWVHDFGGPSMGRKDALSFSGHP